MKFVKDRNLIPSAFEEIIADGQKFTADIIAAGKYFECKSWASNLLSESNFTSQLLNYLHLPSVSSMDDFGFYFDPTKWTPTASDLNAAMKANSNLFLTDAATWNKYLQLCGGDLTTIPLGNINKLIDKLTEPLNFSKIVNPD